MDCEQLVRWNAKTVVLQPFYKSFDRALLLTAFINTALPQLNRAFHLPNRTE
jgi:hypothetical protein